MIKKIWILFLLVTYSSFGLSLEKFRTDINFLIDGSFESLSVINRFDHNFDGFNLHFSVDGKGIYINDNDLYDLQGLAETYPGRIFKVYIEVKLDDLSNADKFNSTKKKLESIIISISKIQNIMVEIVGETALVNESHYFLDLYKYLINYIDNNNLAVDNLFISKRIDCNYQGLNDDMLSTIRVLSGKQVSWSYHYKKNLECLNKFLELNESNGMIQSLSVFDYDQMMVDSEDKTEFIEIVNRAVNLRFMSFVQGKKKDISFFEYLSELAVLNKQETTHDAEYKITYPYSWLQKPHVVPGIIEMEHFDVFLRSKNNKKLRLNGLYDETSNQKLENYMLENTLTGCRIHKDILTTISSFDRCSVVFLTDSKDVDLFYTLKSEYSFTGSLKIDYLSFEKAKVDFYLNNKKLKSYKFNKSSGEVYNAAILDGVAFKKGINTLKVSLKGLYGVSGKSKKLQIDKFEVINEDVRVPFFDYPNPIPGVIQAEHFDKGASHRSYFDSSEGNKFFKNISSKTCSRSGDVDINQFNEVCFIDQISHDEWLSYQLDVVEDGDYDVYFWLSSIKDDTKLEVELGNVKWLFKAPFSKKDFRFKRKKGFSTHLKKGRYELKIRFLSSVDNKNTLSGKFDRIEFRKEYYVERQQKPFLNQPIKIPGFIPVEIFDKGGEGISYSENDRLSNERSICGRNTYVDLRSFGKNCLLTSIHKTEWLEYTVRVENSSYYNVEMLGISNNAGGYYYIQVNGEGKSPPIKIRNSNTQIISEISVFNGLYLKKGLNIIKILFLDSGEYENFSEISAIQFSNH